MKYEFFPPGKTILLKLEKSVLTDLLQLKKKKVKFSKWSKYPPLTFEFLLMMIVKTFLVWRLNLKENTEKLNSSNLFF